MADTNISEQALDEFIGIFAEAQREITDVLENFIAQGTPGFELGRQRVLLKQVSEILDRMDDPSLTWIETWLPESFNRGTLFATDSLKELGLDIGDPRAGFAVVEQRQIQALAESMVIDLDAAEAGILQKFDTGIRLSQLDALADVAASREIAIGLVGGEGVAAIQTRLLEKVLKGEIAPGGFKGSLESYAEMLARTRIAEAQVQGSLTRMEEHNVRLVKTTSHGGHMDDLCASLQGRVFSIDGSDPRFPPLGAVGPPPWHPNCVHRIVPFVEALAKPDELEAALAQAA